MINLAAAFVWGSGHADYGPTDGFAFGLIVRLHSVLVVWHNILVLAGDFDE